MGQRRFLRNSLSGLALLICWPAYGATQPGPVPKIIGCSGDTSVLAEARPETAGPLRLEAFYCTDGSPTNPPPRNRVFVVNDDHESRLAMTNGKREFALQTVAISNFTQAKHVGIVHDSAQIDRQGRMRAVFTLYSFGRGASYAWTQGQLPKQLPYVLNHWASVALAPDAKHLLVQHNLLAPGAICEDDAPCPRTPRAGTIADLRDVETGNVLWEIKGMAIDIVQGYDPVVSPDGRYAIITLPSTNERVMNARGNLALISMTDGKVIQQLTWCPCEMSADFTPDGRALEVRRGSRIITYSIQHEAR